MTRYNLVPADDPASIESFLRLRRSQLPGGRPPVRGTREEAERQSAEHDAERIVDLLRRMPPEEYATAADEGPKALEAAQYDWLRRHGLERGRVDAALGALRDDLNRRVHPSPAVDPAVTAAGGAPGRGRGTGPSTRARPPAAVAQLTAADRRGMLANVAAARAAGYDPDRFYPGWRQKAMGLVASAGSTSRSAPGVVDPGLGRYGRPNLVPATGSGGPDRPVLALGPPVSASSSPNLGAYQSGANRPASRATGRRSR